MEVIPAAETATFAEQSWGRDREETMRQNEKTFILYDAGQLDVTGLPGGGEVQAFYTGGKYAPCKGCFDCWLKTPGTCILRDRVYALADHLADCTTFVIVSGLRYGGFSASVKGVVDRLIAFNLPYFRKIRGELHHIPRYENQFRLRVYFYGDATEREKETARAYVSRIALNFNNEDYAVCFLNDASEWRASV